MTQITVITGPTSVGKTTLALQLAKQRNGVLISADSRQIYKDMDIGTGKTSLNATTDAPKVSPNTTNPTRITKGDTKWVVDGIDIWGYDLATPDTYFSAYEYAKFAITKINELNQNSKYKNIILVGGTGFYIDSVTGAKNLANIEPDFKLREQLQSLNLEQLNQKLMSLNLKAHKIIDTKNPARLIRAIEKATNTTKTIQTLPKLHKNIKFKLIGLNAPRALLYQRADDWLENIWQNGLLQETQNLLQKYKTSDKLNGIIYKSAVEYLTDKKNEATAIQEAKFALHNYIRKQQTYHKKIPNITWHDTTNPKTYQNVENILI